MRNDQKGRSFFRVKNRTGFLGTDGRSIFTVVKMNKIRVQYLKDGRYQRSLKLPTLDGGLQISEEPTVVHNGKEIFVANTTKQHSDGTSKVTS